MSDGRREGGADGLRGPGRLGPAERVRERSDFLRLRREGRRGGDDRLRVQVARNGLGHPGIAAAVPRRYGNAVARNRLRRLYREAFRLEKGSLPACDILCSPPRGSSAPRLGEVRRSLVALVQRVAARLPGDG